MRMGNRVGERGGGAWNLFFPLGMCDISSSVESLC